MASHHLTLSIYRPGKRLRWLAPCRVRPFSSRIQRPRASISFSNSNGNNHRVSDRRKMNMHPEYLLSTLLRQPAFQWLRKILQDPATFLVLVWLLMFAFVGLCFAVVD